MIRIAAAAAIVAAVSLAVAAGGYALFMTVLAQAGLTTAAWTTALAALILAGAVALGWREIERRRRETKAAAAGLSDHLIDFAFERPVVTAFGAAVVGWICLRNPRIVALAAEVLLAGRRETER